jgi:hypothetical protein
MTVDVEQVIPVLAQLTVLGGGIAAAYIGLKRWIEKQAAPAKVAAKQLEPNGGTQESTRHLIEQTAADVSGLTELAAANRELANQALTSAQLAHERIDRHLISDHHLPSATNEGTAS